MLALFKANFPHTNLTSLLIQREATNTVTLQVAHQKQSRNSTLLDWEGIEIVVESSVSCFQRISWNAPEGAVDALSHYSMLSSHGGYTPVRVSNAELFILLQTKKSKKIMVEVQLKIRA